MRQGIIRFLLGIGLVFGIATAASAQTTQVDALIRKLVDKDILSKEEARELRTEIMEDAKALQEEAKNQIIPEWVRKIKIKGDLRTRYQYERRKNDSESRGRGRIRYRMGVDADIVKNIKIGAGFASGSSDPRSTNQTLENSFEHPDLRLDYAYGEWKAWDKEKLAAKITAGKFLSKDYLWTPTDMLWDTDINPNGVALNLIQKLTKNTKGFFNAGYLIIDEANRTDNNDDPFIHYAQAGLNYAQGNTDANVAGVYYGFNDTKNKCPEWTAGSNSGVTSGASGACSGALVHDYDSWGASTEIGFKKLFGGLPLNADGRIALFGDFIHNPDPEAENFGWAFGARLGAEKLSAPKDWQLKYTKVMLERDAFPDFMPDSDRYGGATNVEGHEIDLQYVWKENVILGLDYYKSERIIGAENQEQLIQGDVVFKF